MYIGASPDGQGSAERFIFTATGSTTDTVTHDDNGLAINYEANHVSVYLNGVKQVVGTDVTASNGSTLVFASNLAEDDVVECIALSSYSPADTVPASGGTFTGNVTHTGDVKAGTIKAEDGTAAITVADSTGKVTLAGDFQVNGTTTTLDTELYSVDRLEVGANDSAFAVQINQAHATGTILKLQANGTNVLVVDPAGPSMGIGSGIVDPTAHFHIYDSSADSVAHGTVSAMGGTQLLIEDTAGAIIELLTKPDGQGEVKFTHGDTSDYGQIRYNHNTDAMYFSVNSAGDSTEMTINSGSVVIPDVEIDGGEIDGTTIGASSHTTGKFTTCDATTDFTIGGTVITNNTITDDGTLTITATTGITLGQDTALSAGKDLETSTTGKIKQKGAFMQSSTHQALTLGY